jgi:signal transduction histidine kinase
MSTPDNLATLYKICRAVNRSLDLDEVLGLILDSALNAVHGSIGWISLAEADQLRLVVVRGVARGQVREILAMGEGVTGLAAQTRRFYYAPDVTREKNYYQVSPAIRAELAVPLVAGNELLGVLNVESTQPDSFSPEAIELLGAFAEEAAQAIRNALNFGLVNQSLARTNRELAERVKHLQALADITAALNASLDLDRVLHLVIEHAALSVPAPFCQILLYAAAEGVLKVYLPALAHYPDLQRMTVRLGEGITGRVAQECRPIIVPDVLQDQRYVAFLTETRSEMAAPLLKGDKLVGVINVESFQANAFQERHLETLTNLAQQAVVAIENARLYEDLKKTQAQLLLNERLTTVGEIASDILHWVANKVAIIPRTIENIRVRTPHRDASLEEDLDIIDRNARSVLKLKQEILGRNEKSVLGPVALVPLVEQVVAEFHPPGHVTLEQVVTDSTALVATADTAQLTKVLHYLLENGIDSVPPGKKGLVRIGVRREHGQCCIEIEDNGCGIAPEHLTKLFDTFFTTKAQQGGTGMGLWFAYRTMKRMQGGITVQSEVGKGTKFKIMLPEANI